MKIENLIRINKFGQDLISLNEILVYFDSLNPDLKRSFLDGLAALIIQLRPIDDDIEKAIELGNLKPTYTPCVKIKKGIKSHVLKEILQLPFSEYDKIVILFLSLFKIAYKRMMKTEKDNPTKWWFRDLSDDVFVNRIITLTNIKLMTGKLFNKEGIEIGAVLTAVFPFRITLYEKNVVERQLELYAFNVLYPGKGLNFFKETNDDMASLVVIENLDYASFSEKTISIY